ncbi:MAG: hypothetical protein GQ529_06810 [Methyloprofundus sp.]|nr:hypothetical protein [Methyloprofundus sp.]
MKSIKEVRAAINAQLDEVEAKAEAAKAQFDLSKKEVDARLEQQEKSLLAAAEKLTAKLEEAGVIAAEETTKIKGSLENLQVQLVLGVAETRDAFNKKKADVSRRIAEFNAELDAAKATGEKAAAEEIMAEMQVYVAEAIAMEAELEAADNCQQ